MRSGWCTSAPGARPKCGACRAASCSCSCHTRASTHATHPKLCKDAGHEIEEARDE